MKLQVAPYNNGATTWTEAEETAIISYSITHRFNSPAEAEIVLSDPTGVIARKYNVDANDVFVGPGKVTIEDPTATDIFFGRIMRAEANTDARTLTLYCEDWLSQLNEEQITYDMREKLSGNIRQSTIAADYNSTDGQTIRPAYNAAGTLYVYDNQIGLTADAHNGMYMILTDGMAGNIKVKTGPWNKTANDSDGAMDVDIFIGPGVDDINYLWTEDTDYYSCSDAADYTVDFFFRTWVTDSDFYVASSITGARVYIIYGEFGDSFDASLELYNGGGYDSIGRLIGDALNNVFKKTFEIPENLLSTMNSNTGEAIVRINVAEATGGTGEVYYIALELDVSTTGYTTAMAISDGETYRLTIDTDLSADATKVWNGCPYCVAQKIYKHIDSAETPGALITDGDTMEALTCAATIEHTSGISTRQYKDMTRLQILQDLAKQDKAELFIPLGTTTVTYKSTWNDGAPTALTDTDVNSWKSTFDYSKLSNEFNIYGMRIGDRQLYSNVTDATSILKYKATRSQTKKGAGLVSEHDTLAYGTALVAQYKDVQQILTATIRGNTAKAAHPKTLVLGDEVSITSTYLGLAAANYIIQNWSYESTSDMTTLLLHPRVSQVGLQPEEFGSLDQALQTNRKGDTDKFIAAPESNTIA